MLLEEIEVKLPLTQEKQMPSALTFGSPILNAIQKKYGSKQKTTTVSMRENKDVIEFLEQKWEAEKKTAQENLLFK